MLEIAARVKAGRDLGGIPATSIFADGAVATTPSEGAADIGDYPQPNYGLLSAEMKTKGIIYAMYTRACPYKCKYCSEGRLFGSRLRSYAAADFIDTLDHIAGALGWKFIHIADSTFGLPLRSLRQLLGELDRRGRK